MRLTVCALAFVLTSSITVPVWAQPAPDPLFTAASAAVTAQPSMSAANVVDRRSVGMRLDRLFDTSAAPRVLLNLPGGAWVAAFEHLERDGSGHRSWVGSIEGIEYSLVTFTERDGVVAGLIDGVSWSYQVRTVSPGIYALEQIDKSRFGRELEPLVQAPDADRRPGAAAVAGDDGSVIDVLMLYTPAARTQSGGTSQIQALAAQIMTESNIIYERSAIGTRLRLVGAVEFSLTESPNMANDLGTVTSSPIARGLRDQYRADLVQLLVNSPDLSSCGIAWLLNSLSNTNFNAYSVADIACVGQYTPTHELGHSMGSHHAPEDGASGALFPYSYGYKDPARRYRTVMAYNCSGVSCPRIGNMSNPSVIENGGPTGTSTQNNAASINNAAQTVANFRQADPTLPPPPPVPPPATPPSAPTGLRSQVNGTSVTVSWDAVTNDVTARDAATSYVLRAGTGPGLSNLFNASVGNSTSASGTVPPGTYYWRVFALNGWGTSPSSSEATFTVGLPCSVPGPPQDFGFSLSGRTVTLRWFAPALGGSPTSYIIEAGSATGLANLYNASTGSAATTAVAVAPPGTYFVRIRAQNACGISGPSVERVIVVP